MFTDVNFHEKKQIQQNNSYIYIYIYIRKTNTSSNPFWKEQPRKLFPAQILLPNSFLNIENLCWNSADSVFKSVAVAFQIKRSESNKH